VSGKPQLRLPAPAAAFTRSSPANCWVAQHCPASGRLHAAVASNVHLAALITLPALPLRFPSWWALSIAIYIYVCSVTTPTGALTLDLALGGGYPKGRVVEIYGPGRFKLGFTRE
jgi:recombination protein RecA